MAPRLALLSAAFAAAATIAAAQAQALTYRCTAKDGKKYYGSAIPPQCLGQPIEVINDRGFVVKRIDQAGDERARAAKAAEAEKKRDQEVVNKEVERRNRALLATYTSVKDIESARARALADNAQQASRYEKKIADLKARRARYEKELELYNQGTKKGSSPQVLADNIKNTDLEIQAQEGLLEDKRKEVVGINAKYDEDKRRFSEITARK